MDRDCTFSHQDCLAFIIAYPQGFSLEDIANDVCKFLALLTTGIKNRVHHKEVGRTFFNSEIPKHMIGNLKKAR